MSEVAFEVSKLYFKFRNSFSRCWPRFYYFCDRNKILIKCILAGAAVSLIDLVVLFICYRLFAWSLIISTSAAFICYFLFSFTLQKFWTFRNFNQQKTADQLVMYFVNAFIGLNLNGFFMHQLVNKYHLWYLLAQIIVNITIGTYNFIIYNFVIFKKEKNEISR